MDWNSNNKLWKHKIKLDILIIHWYEGFGLVIHNSDQVKVQDYWFWLFYEIHNRLMACQAIRNSMHHIATITNNLGSTHHSTLSNPKQTLKLHLSHGIQGFQWNCLQTCIQTLY